MTPRRIRPARRARRFRLRFNLRKAMFVLPNLFTVSSIFCGFYAIVLASGTPGPTQFSQATMAVFFGIFFDMADGRVARLTRTQSEFGVQMDSLADVITFGLAPAVIVHKWGLSGLGLPGAVVAFTYVACGAVRLARFNVMAAGGASKKFFLGLPIPLAAGVLTSLVMFHQRIYAAPATRELHILALILVLSYLMISNVRYRTFKDLKLSPKTLATLFVVVVIFIVVAARIEPAFALLAFFSGYVGMGLIEEVVYFRRSREDTKPAAGSGPPPPSP